MYTMVTFPLRSTHEISKTKSKSDKKSHIKLCISDDNFHHRQKLKLRKEYKQEQARLGRTQYCV